MIRRSTIAALLLLAPLGCATAPGLVHLAPRPVAVSEAGACIEVADVSDRRPDPEQLGVAHDIRTFDRVDAWVTRHLRQKLEGSRACGPGATRYSVQARLRDVSVSDGQAVRGRLVIDLELRDGGQVFHRARLVAENGASGVAVGSEAPSSPNSPLSGRDAALSAALSNALEDLGTQVARAVQLGVARAAGGQKPGDREG